MFKLVVGKDISEELSKEIEMMKEEEGVQIKIM